MPWLGNESLLEFLHTLPNLTIYGLTLRIVNIFNISINNISLMKKYEISFQNLTLNYLHQVEIYNSYDFQIIFIDLILVNFLGIAVFLKTIFRFPKKIYTE